jgi:hypothetical protein
VNRIVLGLIIGILLVLGMRVVAQEEPQEGTPHGPARIGSDPFYGQNPEVINKIITAPTPPPSSQTGPRGGARSTTIKTAAPATTVPNAPAASTETSESGGATSSSESAGTNSQTPNANATQENNAPASSSGFSRGY